MGTNISNIYTIENLHELSAQYRRFYIANLRKDQDEYYENCQRIIRDLSFQLLAPVTIIEEDNLPYLIVPVDCDPPTQHVITGKKPVEFRPRDQIFELDFTESSSQNDAVRIRFLNFVIQGELGKHNRLWQPRRGAAYYNKKSFKHGKNRRRYPGFFVRAVPLLDGGIGLCVDVTGLILDDSPLPVTMNQHEFWKRWKGRKCIYRYGHSWYQIVLASLDLDYTVNTKPVLLDDGRSHDHIDETYHR